MSIGPGAVPCSDGDASLPRGGAEGGGDAYGAAWRGEWVAPSFSAAALKCQARDAWIGWTLRHKYDRLHLVANNTRFLLRPVPNLGLLGGARHLVRDAFIIRWCCWRPSWTRRRCGHRAAGWKLGKIRRVPGTAQAPRRRRSSYVP